MALMLYYPFLFLLDKSKNAFLHLVEPEKGAGSFQNARQADGPPYSAYSHSHSYQIDGQRNTNQITAYTDGCRLNGASGSVKHSLHGNFQHHEYL